MSSTSKSTEYAQLPLNSPEDNVLCEGVQIDCHTQRSNIIQRSTSTTEKHAVDQWIQRDLNSQLFTAIFNRDLESVESRLQQGANPNTSCRSYKFTAAHLAVLTGSEKILIQLLTKGAKCTATDRLGLTPLHYASWYNHNKCMELLLQHMDKKEITNFINTKAEKRICIIPDCAKDSLDHTCYKFEDMLPRHIESGCTALHVACQKVHEKCVEIIIRHKPNMQLKDDRNLTAFEVIGELLNVEENSENDFIQIINTVKFFGGKKESSSPIYYFTPLHAAVALSSNKGIKLLINSGLKADQLDDNGETPIHLAIIKQQAVSLKTLLECIPDVSVIRNAMGLTPFQAAVERQWMHGIGMLLNANINVTEVAADGRTVLHVAAASGNVDLLEELFELDDINKILNTKNNIGESPIYCAISSGKLDCVQFLIDKEVDISIKLKGNINVLHRAAELGYADILSILLKVDKEEKLHLIDERDTFEFSGMTPLHMATWNNHVECVKELIAYNCHFTKLTSPSPHCSSMAAHLAANRDHNEILEILLEHDNRLLIHLDGKLRNPLICAALQGSRKCIESLLNVGANLAIVYEDETALDIIFRNVSRPTEFLETMFDTRISIDDKNTRITDKTCLININFDILIPKKDNQMEILSNILDNGKGLDQRKLLLHPLIECFLHFKWKKMSNIFWMLLLFYALFVLFLTLFAMSMFYFKYMDRAIVEVFRGGLILLLFIVSGLEILLLIETIQQFRINLDRFIKWLSIILVAILIWCPFHITENTTNSPGNSTESGNLLDDSEPHNSLRHIGTLAVLTSWIQMMFLLSKVPKWGYYVQMFFKVSKNVLKVMAIFSVLVIGFALAFMIEFQSVDSFSGPFLGIVKTIVMMTSELDYSGIFSDNHNAHVVNLTIYLTFLVLASIVLMNLMVGLAVSDIHDLEIIGKIDRHAQQIEFLSSLETVTMAKYLPSSVKKISARNRVESTLKIYPSDPKCPIMKMLPAKLKVSLFDIAEDNVTRGLEVTLSQLSEKMDCILKMIENLNNAKNIKST